MRLCVQRVKSASVSIGGDVHGSIGCGLLVLFCAEKGDEDDFEKNISYMAKKVSELRIFNDENHKMTHSVEDIGGSVLLISQFTLAGDCSKGRRPDFFSAEKPELAERFYLLMVNKLKDILGEDKVQTGVFGADMQVSSVNDGPVTLIIDKRGNK